MSTLTDFIRDTPFGQGIRWASSARMFRYPEEEPDFLLLHPYIRAVEEGGLSTENENDSDSPEKKQTAHPPDQTSQGHNLVSWYSNSDPANPSNWSMGKKAWVHASINYYAFAIYMASSIYTPAAPELIRIWDISVTVSSLGLGIFVLGYGIGPLLFGPLSEIPAIGRSSVYLVTQFLFLVLSVPTALANNAAGFMVLRFLQGFFGAPALCIAGGTIGDITAPLWLPFMLYVYAFCPLAGPSLGPLIAGFSVPVKGWRWSMWEIVWSVGLSFVSMMFVRDLTSIESYRSQSEIDHQHTSASLIVKNSLFIPWKINGLDPSVLFTSLYCALVYCIFYSFFEVFPLVYMDMYGMNYGEMGLIYLAVLTAVVVGGVPYLGFIHFFVNKATKEGRKIQPETRLVPALVASLFMPTGLFLFAWTSDPRFHWIVPTIGVFLASGAVCIIIQSVFVYIALAYPAYVSSLLAANTFCRAVLALAAVLWSGPLYHDLGVGRGTSILGGLCGGCIIGVFVLWHWGHALRARSRFAVSG